MKIKLGDEVKDIITGFKGIVISKIIYLNGCVQWGVKARVKEAALKEAEYIDEGQIVRLGPGINKSTEEKVEGDKPVRRSGGDQPDSPQKTKSYYAARRRW